MEAEDSYMYGEGWKGRGGGGIRLFGDGPAEGVVVEEGYFFKTFLWLGRQDVYVGRFPVGVPNLLRGGNGGAT